MIARYYINREYCFEFTDSIGIDQFNRMKLRNTGSTLTDSLIDQITFDFSA